VVKYVDYILGRDIWIYRRTCLKRSPAMYRFLGELGMDLKICLGVRFSGKGPAPADSAAAKELEGHAWLTRADPPRSTPRKTAWRVSPSHARTTF